MKYLLGAEEMKLNLWLHLRVRLIACDISIVTRYFQSTRSSHIRRLGLTQRAGSNLWDVLSGVQFLYAEMRDANLNLKFARRLTRLG